MKERRGSGNARRMEQRDSLASLRRWPTRLKKINESPVYGLGWYFRNVDVQQIVDIPLGCFPRSFAAEKRRLMANGSTAEQPRHFIVTTLGKLRFEPGSEHSPCDKCLPLSNHNERIFPPPPQPPPSNVTSTSPAHKQQPPYVRTDPISSFPFHRHPSHSGPLDVKPEHIIRGSSRRAWARIRASSFIPIISSRVGTHTHLFLRTTARKKEEGSNQSACTVTSRMQDENRYIQSWSS